MQKTVTTTNGPALQSIDYPAILIEDIPSHDLHQLYKKLKINEARLELAAEAADAGLWSLDLDAYLFWTNEKTRDIFCFPEIGEITFDHFIEKVHPDDLPIIEGAMHQAINEEKILNIEYRILHPDGSIRWINSRGALHRPVDLTFARLMGVSVDITERKMSEMTIARQLQFETLLATISTTFAGFMLPTDVDAQIENSLGKILDYFGGDRAGLLRFEPSKRKSLIPYAFYREGLEKVPQDADLAAMFPWTYDRLCAGETISFVSLDQLPADAAIDRRSWLAMGVVSALHLPLSVDKDICYVILVQSLSSEIVWATEFLPRFKIIGELFTNAIYKKKADEELRNSYAEITRLKEQLEVEADYLRMEMRTFQSHEQIVGQSDPLKRVLTMVEQVAPTVATVLVCGETGTGKELIAQAIHNSSPRRNRLMVKVNCASLPSSLVESELFGREKGAYTGALTRQMGRFELADGSTLFLDEISEISLELQTKLLRVLQEGEFERLGSPKTIKVDVRIIAATNRNLMEEVKKGRFREDLYYRLNVFPLSVPPLRERIADIPLLVWDFLREFNEKMGKKIRRISSKDMAALQSYSWPGNIRELRNVIEHAVIVSSGDELKVSVPENSSGGSSRMVSLEMMESRYIEETLRQTGWRIKGAGGAAQILGLNPATLYSRMKKLGISHQREKDGMSVTS